MIGRLGQVQILHKVNEPPLTQIKDNRMNNFQKFFIWFGLSLLMAMIIWQSGEFIGEYIEIGLGGYFILVLFISIVMGIEIFQDKDKDKKKDRKS